MSYKMSNNNENSDILALQESYRQAQVNFEHERKNRDTAGLVGYASFAVSMLHLSNLQSAQQSGGAESTALLGALLSCGITITAMTLTSVFGYRSRKYKRRMEDTKTPELEPQ